MKPTLDAAKRACEYLNAIPGHPYKYRIWVSLAVSGDLIDRRRNSDGLVVYVTHADVIALAHLLKQRGLKARKEPS